MKRLAGYGPFAAFVSAASLFVYLFLEEAGSAIASAAPSTLVPLELTQLLTMFLWVAGLVVITFSSGLMSSWVARVAAVFALLMPIPIGIGGFTSLGVHAQAPGFMLGFLGVATLLLTYNFGARRTGSLHGVLPWLGIGIGVAYAICAVLYIGILAPNIGMTLFMTGFNINLLAEVAYMVWSVWIGVKLMRSKTAISALPHPAAV